MYGTINIPLGRNANLGHLPVETDRFNDVVHRHVYEYGLRQIVNDAMADKKDDDGVKLSDDQIIAKAEKRLATLYSGELRTRNGGSAEPVDPIEREAYRLAREKIEVQFRGLGIWPAKGRDKFTAGVTARHEATNGATPADANEYIAAWLERNPKVIESAKRIVKQRDVDVSDLV